MKYTLKKKEIKQNNSGVNKCRERFHLPHTHAQKRQPFPEDLHTLASGVKPKECRF